jgi:trigger factor
MLVSEVVRGKALASILESATVVDASGRPVDLEELRADATPVAGGGDDAEEDVADEE